MSALRDRLTAAVAELKAALASDVSGELARDDEAGLLESVKLLGEAHRLGGALGVRAAAEVERRNTGDDPISKRHGWRSTPDLLAFTAGLPAATTQQWCTVGTAVASGTSLLGETLPAERPQLGLALDAGLLPVEAAAILARELRKLGPHASFDELEAVEGFLVQEAQVLTLRQLGRVCIQLQDRFNPDGIEPREELMRLRSGLRRVQRRDGGIRWILDPTPEQDGVLLAAVDARTAPRRRVRFGDAADPAVDPATADDRTLAQRRLEAFVGMARESLARDDGELAGLPVTMLVTVSLETLQTGIGSATIAGVDTPISAGTARRLACSANIIPIVLGGESEVLDVGRANRLFTRGQRLALAARDRGCTWPGCEAPPGWCEAAHSVRSWLAGGKTSLDNAALLCPYHHHRLDNDGWEFEVRGGVPWFIPPPSVDPSRTPRRGGRERLPATLVG
jgi:hypothetical protein